MKHLIFLFLLLPGCELLTHGFRVKAPFWGDLRPVEFLIPDYDTMECYKGTVRFYKGGKTLFDNLVKIDRKHCFSGNMNFCMSRDQFDENWQYNLFYINERWEQCR